jgi:hypothetical protein
VVNIKGITDSSGRFIGPAVLNRIPTMPEFSAMFSTYIVVKYD